MGKKKQASLIERIGADIAALTVTPTIVISDDKVAELTEKLMSRTTYLAQLPALTASDQNLKLAILCRRLREHLEPGDPDAVLNSLLAESVRDDFERQRQLAGKKPKALR